MKPRRLIHLVLALVAFAALASGALAYWTAPGTGSASASVASLGAPTGLSATPSGSTVNVSWDAVAAPGSGTVGYYVTRDSSAVCGTAASPITATSCSDSGVASGSHSYTVTAVWKTWTATSGSVAATVSTQVDHFTVTAPSSATAGSGFSVSVVAKDSGDHTVTGYTGTVHFTSTDSGSQTALPANYTFTSADNGSHTFTGVKLTAAGNRTITINDTAQTSKTGTSGAIAVSAAAADRLAFTTQPGNGTGGSALSAQPVVEIRDAYGNKAGTNTSAVTLAITSGTGASGAALACTSNPLSATAGVAAFAACKIDKAATGYKLTATDGSLTSATTNAFDVTVGAASKLGFTTAPGGGTGGTVWATQPVVAVQDAGGNTVTTDTSAVSLAIFTGPSGSNLACASNPKAAVGGVASFAGCKIDKVGANYTLTATDGTLQSATSSTFGITAGPAATFALNASASTIASGGTTNLGITAVDAGGNTATGYTGAKTLTFSGATASPSGDKPTVTNASGTATAFGTSTSINFANGIAAASAGSNGVAKLYKAETANVAVTDGTLSSQAVLPIAVGAGAPSRYAWTSLTKSAGAFSDPCYFQCTVTALGNNNTVSGSVSLTDAAGNIVSNLGVAQTVRLGTPTPGAFTAPTSGTSVNLTIPASGAATSAATFTFKAGTGSWSSDSFQASSSGGTTYTSSSMAVTKN